MSRLALMYGDGEGVAYDFDKSVYWDLKAIEAGCTSSMSNLAITYRNMVMPEKPAGGLKRHMHQEMLTLL